MGAEGLGPRSPVATMGVADSSAAAEAAGAMISDGAASSAVKTTSGGAVSASPTGTSNTGVPVGPMAAATGSGAGGTARSPESSGAGPPDSAGSPITARGVPTPTVSPSGTRISWTTPAAGEGTSVSTLSVEIFEEHLILFDHVARLLRPGENRAFGDRLSELRHRDRYRHRRRLLVVREPSLRSICITRPSPCEPWR